MREPESQLIAAYFEEVRRHGLLDRQSELELARAAVRGDAAARDDLVRANLGFVVRVARQYRNFGLPFEDLLNEGNVGLLLAAQRFDPERGVRFITWAVWWIRKTILIALAHRSSLIRVPHYQRQRLTEIGRAERGLRGELGRLPRREELSARLGTDAQRVERCLGRRVRTLSLDDPHDEKGTPLAALLPDTRSPRPDEDLIRRERHERLHAALGKLPALDRSVLVRRHGLGGEPPLVLREIGDELGLSRERVRQIEARAKARLARILARRNERPGRAGAVGGRRRAAA
jgi:RNA polymerase primary sigma factor